MVYTMNRDSAWQKIHDHLPEPTKQFYTIAYNSALQWYGEEDKAHRIAWSAVRSQAVSLNSTIAM
jgi:cation transport regulator